jgi:hypothetical protein
MFTLGKDFKIGWVIVLSVTIDVVNILIWGKATTNLCFCHKLMLIGVAVWIGKVMLFANLNLDVTVGTHRPATVPPGMLVATAMIPVLSLTDAFPSFLVVSLSPQPVFLFVTRHI